MAIPANQDATTAIAITSLPYNTTQDVHDIGTGLTYTVWYSYTPSTDSIISVFPFGALIGYAPLLNIWTGDPNAPTVYLNIFNYSQRPTYFPVKAGQNYFFQIVTPGGNPSPAILTLHVEEFVTQSVPSGAILINDAFEGWPLGILSPTTGVPLRYVQNVVAGEIAARVNNGTIMYQNATTGELVIYDNNYNLIAIIPAESPVFVNTITSNKVDRFYAGVNGTAPSTYSYVKAYSLAGGLLNTWTITGNLALNAITVSLDNTILYHGEGGFTPAVKRWDLINNVALSDLVPADLYPFYEALTLNDGTILILYRNNGPVPYTAYIKRYSAAGVLLNTYNLTGNVGSDPRIAYGLNDPTTFWVWYKIASNLSRFQEINADTGAIVTQFERIHYTAGQSDAAITATPTEYFGHSESCNFLIAAQATPIVPTNNRSGIYKIVPGKRNDTLWNNLADRSTTDVKKPNPFIKTGYLGE